MAVKHCIWQPNAATAAATTAAQAAGQHLRQHHELL